MTKKISLEKSFEKLEQIVNKMELGSEDLEKSMKLYEEGLKISEDCHNKLEELDKRVKILSENKNGNFKEKDMD